jgi:hypothetical protein
MAHIPFQPRSIHSAALDSTFNDVPFGKSAAYLPLPYNESVRVLYYVLPSKAEPVKDLLDPSLGELQSLD